MKEDMELFIGRPEKTGDTMSPVTFLLIFITLNIRNR